MRKRCHSLLVAKGSRFLFWPQVQPFQKRFSVRARVNAPAENRAVGPAGATGRSETPSPELRTLHGAHRPGAPPPPPRKAPDGVREWPVGGPPAATLTQAQPQPAEPPIAARHTAAGHAQGGPPRGPDQRPRSHRPRPVTEASLRRTSYGEPAAPTARHRPHDLPGETDPPPPPPPRLAPAGSAHGPAGPAAACPSGPPGHTLRAISPATGPAAPTTPPVPAETQRRSLGGEVQGASVNATSIGLTEKLKDTQELTVTSDSLVVTLGYKDTTRTEPHSVHTHHPRSPQTTGSGAGPGASGSGWDTSPPQLAPSRTAQDARGRRFSDPGILPPALPDVRPHGPGQLQPDCTADRRGETTHGRHRRSRGSRPAAGKPGLDSTGGTAERP
ncbi:basic proline-rich protein-like [Meles meles]|uniref:basic proline-rich protein-like n=1 Tax=Meles meles TaxID=9662 RepID=UPI001E69911D|nr:basic proline-rich protein-like [Meles meles]